MNNEKEQKQDNQSPQWQSLQPKGGNVFSRNRALWLVIAAVLIVIIVVVVFLRTDTDGLSEAEKLEIMSRLEQKENISENEKEEIISRLRADGQPLNSDEKNEVLNRLGN